MNAQNHRPDFMQHFPPLDSKSNELSQNPKIVSRGALTLATPANQIKFHRKTSDLIANNYSPQAKNLRTRSIHDFNKNNQSLDNLNSYSESNLVKSTNFSYGSWGYLDQKSIKFPKLEPKKQDIKDNRLLKLKSLKNFTSSKSKVIKVKKENIIQKKNRLVEDNLTEPSKLEKIFSYVLNDKDVKNNSIANIKKKHALLDKNFDFNQISLEFDTDLKLIPWYTSTYGLTRANSPNKQTSNRYQKLVNDSIAESMLFPLSEEVIERIKTKVNKQKLIDQHDKFVNSFETSIKDHYIWSIKKSILDYVLKDEIEQERLGVKIVMKKNHSAGRFFCPWHETYQKSKIFAKNRLFLYNNVLIHKIYFDFNQKYSNFRLIDLNELKKAMPLTIHEFYERVEKKINENKDLLNLEWINDCKNLLLRNKNNIEATVSVNFSDNVSKFIPLNFFCI